MNIHEIKLQLALDVLNTDDAVRLADETSDFIDIIEVGTPLIKHEGLQVVRALKEKFPDKEILVDLKSMDVGEYEADFCFNAGADIVTVLGVADIETIKGSVKSARNNNGKVMVDMINVQEKKHRLLEIIDTGADYVGVHSGIDQQKTGNSVLVELDELSDAVDIPVFVAGGINITTIDDILERNPHVVVVGGAITSSHNPRESAKELKERLYEKCKLPVT